MQLPVRFRQTAILHALGLIPAADNLPLTVREANGTTRSAVVSADPEQPHWKLPEAAPYPDDWVYLPATLETPLPLCLRNPDIDYWYEYLPERRTVYFQFNHVRDAPGESLATFCDRLFRFIEANPVERLVLDMRFNDGGNTYLEIPLLHHLIASKVNYKGGLFVIIGRRTFSAAQNGSCYIDFHTNAIFVGEPTGSRPIFIGETAYFDLPYSGCQANISDLNWVGTWPGDFRTWIAPTLYTPPTFAAFSQNRDPAMEAILDYREQLPVG